MTLAYLQLTMGRFWERSCKTEHDKQRELLIVKKLIVDFYVCLSDVVGDEYKRYTVFSSVDVFR